jgi:hypothetical protein
MAALKTRANNASVPAFLNGIEDPAVRRDCKMLAKLMQEVTGSKPRMWGTSVVGFGTYSYSNTAGGGDWFLTGFSPRKGNLTMYIMSGFGPHKSLMAKLGKYKTGKSCLYVRQLDDVHPAVLRKLVAASVKSPMGAAG